MVPVYSGSLRSGRGVLSMCSLSAYMVVVAAVKTSFAQRCRLAVAHRPSNYNLSYSLLSNCSVKPQAEIASWHTLEDSTRSLPRAANGGASPARARKKLSTVG